MRKTLLTLGAALLALGATAQAPELNPTDYEVYNNGVLNPEMHVYGWYNDAMNFKATNPDGTGEVFEFKAANGGAAASAGLNMEPPQNTGIFHNATLNIKWYATTEATYAIRLTSVVEQDYTFTPSEDQLNKWNTLSLDVASTFPAVAKEWNENINLGKGYVFSIILTNGTADSAIYFEYIYYSNVDYEWEAPETEIPAPTTFPTPEQASDDVFSFFSSYENNVNYNIGGWGQSTQVETVQIDGKDVLRLRNFNYLGLVDFNINISDYDYMHVDYWTPSSENVSFGFVPISLNPTIDTPIWVAPEIKAGEWNSYDAPLSSFSADMSSIEQLKFVANLDNTPNTEFGYIANIYFYKDGDEEDPGTTPEPTEPAVYKGSVSGTIDQVPAAGGAAITFAYTIDYTITYNTDKTLTINANVSFPGDTPFGLIDTMYTIVNNGPELSGIRGTDINTTQNFNYGETIPVFFKFPIGNGAIEKTIDYKVGDIDTGINGIIDNAAGSVEYYNLQGVKVANPENGIFIRVEGGKVSKILK